MSTQKIMTMKPIGVIHSPYKTRAEAPRQGTDDVLEVEIFKEYSAGLADIDGFSHLHVFYWLHESQGHTLAVNTPWDSKPHGVFSTRTPNRPNPLGYAAVRLLGRIGNVLKVAGLDAIEGTPVVDIKPYVAKIDAKPDSEAGWLEGKLRGKE